MVRRCKGIHAEGAFPIPANPSRVCEADIIAAMNLNSPATPVVVVGFDMPFWPLVRFLVKIAIASIPAGIVIALFYMVLGWIYGALLLATHHTGPLPR